MSSVLPLNTNDEVRAGTRSPGTLTSAFLTLRLYSPDFKYEVVPFDQIIDAVTEGRCDAGLLIHEGQLFYHNLGLKKVLDLGEWWHDHTGGLPLPMGGNAIRRDILAPARRAGALPLAQGAPVAEGPPLGPSDRESGCVPPGSPTSRFKFFLQGLRFFQ